MHILSVTAHLVVKPSWLLLQLPFECNTFDSACEWVIRYAPQQPDVAIVVAEVYILDEPRTRTFKFDSQQKCVVEMSRRRGWQRIPDLKMENR